MVKDRLAADRKFAGKLNVKSLRGAVADGTLVLANGAGKDAGGPSGPSQTFVTTVPASGAPVLDNPKLATAYTLGLYRIPLEWIQESADNERKTYDADALDELAASMGRDGRINNIAGGVFWVGVKKGKPCFELWDGHRRLRALMKCRAPYMKVEITPKAASEKDARKRRMTSNLQREDLSPLDLSAAWKELLKDGKYSSVEAMADDMGMRSKANSIRDLIGLDRLAPSVRKELAAGNISKSHGVLLAKEEAKEQPGYLMLAFDDEYDESGKKTGRTAVSEHKFRQRIKQAKLNAQREAEWKKQRAKMKENPPVERDWEKEQRERQKKQKEEEARAAAAATVTIESILKREAHKTDLPIEIVRLLAKQTAPAGPHGIGKVVRARYKFTEGLNYKEQAASDAKRIDEMPLQELYDFLLCSMAVMESKQHQQIVLGALTK